jgi:hypothetical protein
VLPGRLCSRRRRSGAEGEGGYGGGMDTGGGWREMSAAGRNPSNTAAVLRFDELFLFSTSFFSLTPYSTAREPTTTMRRGAGGSDDDEEQEEALLL